MPPRTPPAPPPGGLPPSPPPKRGRGGSTKATARGGRAKGSKNKATLEREAKARLELERQTILEGARTAQAADVIAHARAAGVKLAKEVLQDFMQLFAGMAAFYQPAPPNQPPNLQQDEGQFEKYARLAVQTARDLAPYESPTFRAIVVAPAPDNTRGETRKRFTLGIFDNLGREEIKQIAPPPGANGSGKATSH